MAAGMLLHAPLPGPKRDGSIIIVLATDAPLDAHQLRRLAARGALGLARTGSVASHDSGDFTIAFSNFAGNRLREGNGHAPRTLTTLPNHAMTDLFRAAVETVEEAILNSLCAGGDMVGRDAIFVPGLPVEELRQLWRAHHLG
jgi:D-aminopeptidase